MLKSAIFTVAIVIALLLGACAPAMATPSPATPSPVLTEEIPVTSVAVVKSIEIQILESMPVQVNAVLRGDLPDAGCTTIRSVDQVREDNTIKLTVTTTTDPLALCEPAPTPFEHIVALDVRNLPAGEYTVSVDGIQESFNLPAQQVPVEDVSQFNQILVDALNARDYEQLKSLMGDPFVIAYWLSEGTSNTPDQAIEQLQRNLLSSDSPVTADPETDLDALLGMDPATIVGPDAVEVSPLFTSGWGPEGDDEAILFVAKRPSGEWYWYGLLFAKDGFQN